jgi:membrane-bound lytic murein transglycosylase D
MDPASALPSYRVYRGSLVALLIGSVFAVWLLIRPGGGGDQVGPPAALAAVLPSPTATARGDDPTPTPAPPGPTAVAPTAPPGTSTPAPTPTPELTHTVLAGESLSSIAQRYRGNVEFATFLSRIYALNGLTESSLIAVGDVIKIPPS